MYLQMLPKLLAIFIIGLLSSQTVTGQASQCVQRFDIAFKQCFSTSGGFDVKVVMFLVTDGSSGQLPANLAGQKQTLVTTLCANRQVMISCIQNLASNTDAGCQQKEIGMIQGTVNTMTTGLESLCGASSGSSPCMKTFDAGFRQCVTAVGANPDNFFKMLADQPLPAGVNKETLKQSTCSDATKKSLVQCATVLVGQIKNNCENKDTITVGTTLQNMMGAYEALCSGKPFNPGKCIKTFEDGLNSCAQNILNMDSKLILMVLHDQTLPAGQDGPKLKKQICGQWQQLEMCGKDVILAAGCARNQLLQVEAMFANIMITIATTCNIESIPGACLLKLEKNFGECYGKVGLSPDIYLSNDTEHAGSLIGANEAEAEVYCKKKHDLFTCMQEVVTNCKGAEQTLSLTGFDLHGMERAVGLLCRDVPDYLAGLQCFKEPTDAAKKCMEDMAGAVTDLSTKQISEGMKMDNFFDGFCSVRVQHVACDGAAWPSCSKPAIDLKNKFECNLIPSRCYNSHKDHIDEICPNSVAPPPQVSHKAGDPLPDCATNIHTDMNKCFAKFDMVPDMFLVNITDDRRSFMGDADKAKLLCQSKDSVFECMRKVLDSCPHAVHVLAFWGHEQDALEEAVNVVCKALPLYGKGQLSCFANGNSKVQQCMSNTQTKMVSLANKQVEKSLSSDMYFRDFCSIRVEHLRCDVNGWNGSCEDDVVGLKTEFECKLIQEHCKNLQVSNFNQICNNPSSSGGSGNGGVLGTSSNQGGNGASSTSSGWVFSLITSVLATLILSLK